MRKAREVQRKEAELEVGRQELLKLEARRQEVWRRCKCKHATVPSELLNFATIIMPDNKATPTQEVELDTGYDTSMSAGSAAQPNLNISGEEAFLQRARCAVSKCAELVSAKLHLICAHQPTADCSPITGQAQQ